MCRTIEGVVKIDVAMMAGSRNKPTLLRLPTR
jgi:hypothetical protein